jgi:hypothetical protein
VEKKIEPTRTQDDNIIRRMRFSGVIPKATNTQSKYVTLITFPLQQTLYEHALMLRYTYIALSCYSISCYCRPYRMECLASNVINVDVMITFIYEGESNENLKLLIFFISQFTEHERYTMASFFYVVSIAFHTSFPALRKCMDTSRKKILLAGLQPLVHNLLHLFVRPERLYEHPSPLVHLL